MTKEMIISSNGHETMVAILEDDLVAEIFVERERQRGVVGNVYKGRVSKVLPGMQSSFIDLGLERDGFLYVADVIDTARGIRQARSGRRGRRGARAAASRRSASATAAAEDRGPAQGRPGDPRPGRQGAARHQRRAAHLARDDAGPVPGVHADRRSRRRVAEDRIARGARRLRGIVREFREAHGFTGGVIIRTAAAGRPKEDIVSDLDAFHEIWTEIRQKMESSRAPAVVYREQSLVGKLLRDLLTEEFQAIRIDNAQEYQRVLELVERILPTLAPKVKLYSKPFPIFEEYGVQAEIDKALKSKVWLKSGGSIVINQTEALVAIDVNTGRYVGKKTSGPPRGHDRQDQPRSGEGNRAADPAARPRRHHRARLHRHGGEEEPAEGAAGGRAGAEEGPVAVEGAAGLRLRPRHHHAQAREAEPRARADRAVSRTARAPA